MFHKLVAFETEVDMNLQRRRSELHDELRGGGTRKATLRLWVHHTYTSDELDAPPGWTLKVVGKLVDDKAGIARKFTSFVKNMQVRLTGGPAGEELVEWNKPLGFEDVDGLEVKRQGKQDLTAELLINLDFSPRRYQLSQQLRQILELADQPETRPKVLEALWHLSLIHI
eukprot:TRINITY_DN18603_c0_g1_i2.p1 TRINITY_DN18603_c0_g1~~TRINITY_DN18603_c0_g1_i2.p1  ORF type:complete len:192 (+),score=53.40 TRINITY_DN18603_c0_g1_i2:69-578(+)